MAVSQSFAQIVAERIGAPVDRVKQILDAWEPYEGTAAKYNPLATTQNAPGATSFNSVGVRNFPDEATGAEATAQTLLNGYYPAILDWMRTGNLDPSGVAKNLRTWGTTGFAAQVEQGSVGADTTDTHQPGVMRPPYGDASLRGSPVTAADIRNAASNPSVLSGRLLQQVYDAQDAFERYKREQGLILKDGQWVKKVPQVVQSGKYAGQPTGEFDYVPDTEAARLQTEFEAQQRLVSEYDTRVKQKYYQGGSAATEQYINSLDLEDLNQRREKAQWDNAVKRWSDINNLMADELAYNKSAFAANRQTDSPIGSVGGNPLYQEAGTYSHFQPITMDQAYSPQARQLLFQQGYGTPGEGDLAPLSPVTSQDFAPAVSWQAPQDTEAQQWQHFTQLPKYAMGTDPSWPWQAPQGTPAFIVGVPTGGLWSGRM